MIRRRNEDQELTECQMLHVPVPQVSGLPLGLQVLEDSPDLEELQLPVAVLVVVRVELAPAPFAIVGPAVCEDLY